MGGVRRFLDQADINRFRFWTQIFCFALLVYGGYLGLNLGNSLPTFACTYTEGRGGICYLYPLQRHLNSTWQSLLDWRGVILLTGLATFVAWVIFLNKAWCGFVCPFGTLQDWISRLRNRLGVRYTSYRESTLRAIRPVKYLLLALLILIPLGIANPILGVALPQDMSQFFCRICPARMITPLFSGDVSQLVVDFSTRTTTVLTGIGLAVTGIFFIGAFMRRRFFCLFCPMSAFLYLFKHIGLLRLHKKGELCTRCGNCLRVCDMQIRDIADNLHQEYIVREDCMMCLKCVAACPEPGALKASFLGMPVFNSTQEGFFKRMGYK